MTASTPLRRARPRLYLVHRWIGLVVAVVGTLILFSGALATVAEEIDDWAARTPTLPAVDAVPGFDLDAAWDRARAELPAEAGPPREVVIRQARGGPLRARFSPGEGEDRREPIVVALDPRDLSVLDPAPASETALARFVIELHVFLLLPQTLGLIVTGLTALALLVLLASGLWVHRVRWAKLVAAPRRGRLRQLSGDLHTLVGTWTLPFTALLAATGAFLCLSTTLVLPGIAALVHGGDRAAMLEPFRARVDNPADPELGPGEGPALDPIVRDALGRSEGAVFRQLRLHEWGTDAAQATVVLARESPWRSTRTRDVYDGRDGAWLGPKPALGARPSRGGALLELVDALHFGTLFGGLNRAAWAVLGLLSCALASTGLLVYATRQRGPDRPTTRLVRGLAVAMSVGLPLSTALVIAAWALSTALGIAEPDLAMSASLVLALGLTTGLGVRLELRAAVRTGLALAGLGLLAAPGLALLATGVGPRAAWLGGQPLAVVGGDLTLVAIGLGLLALGHRFRPRSAPCPPPFRQDKPCDSF